MGVREEIADRDAAGLPFLTSLPSHANDLPTRRVHLWRAD
jgi:hypothetical protein